MPRLTFDWFGFRVYPSNIPKKLPGVYLFTNMHNGKKYVGVSYCLYDRCRDHSRSASTKITNVTKNKIRSAFASYGRHSFLLTPLYYTLRAPRLHLLEIEAQLISDYDSVRSGYNICESGGLIGPYGKEFIASLTAWRKDEERVNKWRDNIKAGMATPEAQAKAAAFLADPVKQARRGKAVKAGLAQSDKWAAGAARRRSPAARAANAARGRAQFATEEARQASRDRQAAIADKHREALLRAHANCPRHWITDGAVTRKAPVADPIPSGWYKGRAAM